jgi:HK97 family phage major capsid protein
MNEIYAMPSVTQKLLDMSDFDVAQWLLEEINDVFVTTEGTGFITGNGVSRVKGIIDSALMIANASWEYGKTGYIASGNASLLNSADKLVDLQHSLKPVYRQNGTWLMNDTTFSVIRKFKDGDGNYLWRPGLLENAPDTLLGKPVELDDNMPDIGANAYPIAFGDFKRAYTIVDHVSGTRLLRDPYTTKGFVNFYVTKRLAGGISNYEAIKFMKIATS